MDTSTTDWTAGYVADIGYTFGYYPELNPLRAKLAFLNAGLAFPEIGTACELGFGQGLSANIHAAASVTEWSGTDFNPSQAAFAQELAAVSSGAKLYDDAFADFCKRPELPDFDYIGLHGIWSWISDENRAVIVDFVRRKLKVGGILYISYNTLPGWAAFAPMRHLLNRHADVIGAEGVGIISRIDGALEFADKLMALNPTYARANPQIAERLKRVKEHNRHYLAHEYFNRDWHPMHFSTMGEWLSPAKVSFACSASYLDHVDVVNLTAEQQAFLKEIPDTMFREAVRDFIVNQQFRKDYWVKGPRKVSQLEQTEALRALRFVLVMPRPDVSLKVTGMLGEANMSENVYGPILDVFADHKPKSIGYVEQQVQGKGINFAQVVQAVLLLASSSSLMAVQDEKAIAKVRPRTDKLNAHLCTKARSGNDIAYLASPATGGGIGVPRFPQLFLTAQAAGRRQPAEMAQYASLVLSSQGQKILKDGKALETEQENLDELNQQAIVFAEKTLPILKALGVA